MLMETHISKSVSAHFTILRLGHWIRSGRHMVGVLQLAYLSMSRYLTKLNTNNNNIIIVSRDDDGG